jgi:hypothetical protein
MKRINGSLSQGFRSALVATLFLSATALTFAQTAQPKAATAASTLSVPVNVTNPSLSVTGNVNANVTGTVGVSSLPAVQLAGTPAVQLSTTSTTPVYVDSDRSARNGFNASCSTGNIDPVYGQASCSVFTIPAGREVVIETISCQAEVPAGQGPGDVQLVIPSAASNSTVSRNNSHFLALSKQDGNASLEIWRITTPLRAYGSAPAQGTADISLFFRGDPSAPNPQGLFCTISGFMVGQ